MLNRKQFFAFRHWYILAFLVLMIAILIFLTPVKGSCGWAKINGKAIEDKGRIVGNVEIVPGVRDSNCEIRMVGFPASTHSDSRGMFDLDRLPPGRCDLRIINDYNLYPIKIIAVGVKNDEITNVGTIIVGQYGNVAGRVSAANVGFPSELFPGLIITVKGTDVAARPDAYGYYLLNHVAPGERIIEVQGLWYSEPEKNRQKMVTLNSGQLLRGVNFIFNKAPLSSGQTFEMDEKKNNHIKDKTGKNIISSRPMQSRTDQRDGSDINPYEAKMIMPQESANVKETYKERSIAQQTGEVVPKPRFDLFEELEEDTDRPGNNYRNFDLPHPEPEICLIDCQVDPRCKAFTYVKPGLQGPKARCWLKDTVPTAKPSPGCISGVKR